MIIKKPNANKSGQRQVEKPVFIIGCPRSGTTIFMKILSMHPQFSWPSQYINRFPSYYQLAFLSRIYDIPILGSYLRKSDLKCLPRPVESWDFLRRIDPKFYPHLRSSSDVQSEMEPALDEVTTKFIKSVKSIQRYQGKNRFVAKYTNKPRIKYLNSIFPDSLFIHILRDEKAVVNSLYNNVINLGWIGLQERKNWIGVFPAEWKKNISRSSDPTISFLSYYYCHIVNRITDQQSLLSKERTTTINYEDFIAKPNQIFKYIFEFLKVSWTPDFEAYLLSKKLINQNYKWKYTLTGQQINIIEKILAQSKPKTSRLYAAE